MDANNEPVDPRDALDLTGRVAIVTGAGTGIGAAVAETLANAGAHVVCTDIDKEAVEHVAEGVRESGGSALAYSLDVASKAEIDARVDQVITDHGRLDVLCNNAGIMIDKPAAEITEDEWDKVLAINLKGVLFGCQAAARVMRAGGSVVNMTSSIIDRPTPGKVAYASSKAGIVQVTRAFALELGERGVRFNATAPGFVVTAMTSRHFRRPDGTINEARLEEALVERKRASPLQGMLAEPVDVAMTVLFLASDAARSWTGQVLRPNGGLTMA